MTFKRDLEKIKEGLKRRSPINKAFFVKCENEALELEKRLSKFPGNPVIIIDDVLEVD